MLWTILDDNGSKRMDGNNIPQQFDCVFDKRAPAEVPAYILSPF